MNSKELIGAGCLVREKSVSMEGVLRTRVCEKKLLGPEVEERKFVDPGLPCGEKLPQDPIGVSYAYFYNPGMLRENGRRSY